MTYKSDGAADGCGQNQGPRNKGESSPRRLPFEFEGYMAAQMLAGIDRYHDEERRRARSAAVPAPRRDPQQEFQALFT